MRGEFVAVWSEMWREIWLKIERNPASPNDLFCEVFRELEPAFRVRLDPAIQLADIVDDPEQSRREFRSVKSVRLRGELPLVEFLERVHLTLFDLGGDDLSSLYFKLMEQFIEKYSLRYDLRRPFSLHPTVSGMFSRLMRELGLLASRDAALYALLHDFEEAIRDLKMDNSPVRIRTCIHRQINFLEALTQRRLNINSGTLGAMCDEIQTWPHATVKDAMKKLYGFSSNYPGIRHAGNPASALRDIEMRDLVGMTVILAGFVPYLSEGLDAAELYGGAKA
jgi:hypothetical protein